MAQLLYANQYFLTTLNVGGGITDSATTGIVLADVSGVDTTKPGMALINYADPLNTTICEWVEYTSINGSKELVGVTRGSQGFSAKSHSNGVSIAFPFTEDHINRLNAMFDSTGVDIKQISTPASPSSGRNKIYFKSDEKVYSLTSAGVETQITPTSTTTTWTTITDAATVTMDLSLTPQRYEVTLGGNRTLAFSNAVTGQAPVIRLIQDGTGSRTVTHPTKAVTMTMTIAAPCVVTAGLDIPTTTPIVFTTSGALPTGIVSGTTYYYIRVNSTTGNLATTIANAQAGTTITTTGSQSGTHTGTLQVRWAGQSAPSLTTGKYRADLIGYVIKDATNGIYEGYIIGQDI